MKRILSFCLVGILSCLIIFSLSSYKNAPSSTPTEVLQFSDSTKFASVSLNVELPIAQGGAVLDTTLVLKNEGDSLILVPRTGGTALQSIRNLLILIIDFHLRIAAFAVLNDGETFPSYVGDFDNTEALLAYYLKHVMKAFSDDAKECESKFICDFSISLRSESEKYICFYSEKYLYLGGAHGLTGGEGSLTFDKTSGKLLTNFLIEDCEEAIQPVLRKGLIQYFLKYEYGDVTDENLHKFLSISFNNRNTLIPLPDWTPSPTPEGLVFTYGEYEIACYACGRPTFTVPYSDILPFLTPEAKKLLML